MRTIVTLLVLVVIAAFGWNYVQENPSLSKLIPKNLKSISLPFGSKAKKTSKSAEQGDFLTLEARYKPDQVVQARISKMLKGEEYTVLPPETIFFPFALMEVKYTKNQKATGEGQILWGLENGEMVINATTWKVTHGFEDCIEAQASHDDFQIINVLAMNGGMMDRDSLFNALHVERHVFDTWLESTLRKKLVVLSGNSYRLHFERPDLNVTPETTLKDPIVAKQTSGTNRVPAHFSLQQIENISKAAFGPDFFIRRTKTVYLPVYRIGIQNPDGSIHTTYWNAFTGTEFEIETR